MAAWVFSRRQDSMTDPQSREDRSQASALVRVRFVSFVSFVSIVSFVLLVIRVSWPCFSFEVDDIGDDGL